MAEKQKSHLSATPPTSSNVGCKGTTNNADTQISSVKSSKENSVLEKLKAHADRLVTENHYSTGCLVGKTFNQVMDEALAKPIPKALFSTLWYEGENCVLYGDAGCGKTILGVQIAKDIAASGKVVLYFNFELSDTQLLLRYKNANGEPYKFPPTLIHEEMKRDEFIDEASLMTSIEAIIVKTGAKVLFIDNLTYVCLDAEKGATAGAFMTKLVYLKKKYGLSVLVIAHTPKRNDYDPITLNDLAGSKKLSNFFDSAIAIGKVVGEPNRRYIKQIKGRVGALTHDASRVMLCEIENTSNFTRFRHFADVAEKTLLSVKEDRQDKRAQALDLYRQGMKIKDIADEIKVPAPTIYKWIK